MREIVLVGKEKLIGEVIELKMIWQLSRYTKIQQVLPGEPVVPTGKPLSLKLARA